MRRGDVMRDRGVIVNGVICPACIQPQFDAGKEEAEPVLSCRECWGQGVVTIQDEIAYLKRHKIGPYRA